MPRYYHEHSHHKQKKFIRKLKAVLVGLILIGVVSGGYLGFDAYRATKEAAAPSAPTDLVTSVYAPKTEVFTTQYFQFEANRTWSIIASETSSNTYTYRSSSRGLTQQDLTITVNNIAPRSYGRVLPVALADDDVLSPSDMSPLCSTLLPKTAEKVDQIAKYEDTEFLCDYDATDFTAIVGPAGGRAPLSLKRPDGSSAVYTIVYRNLTATPSDSDIRQILSTFQTR